MHHQILAIPSSPTPFFSSLAIKHLYMLLLLCLTILVATAQVTLVRQFNSCCAV